MTAAALAGTVALLGAAALLSGAAAAPAPTANVTARTLLGQRLGPDPQVLTGEVLVVEVSGFAPAAVVTVAMPDGRTQSVRADPRGTVDLVYVVPPGLANGQYVIDFTAGGAVAAPSSSGATPTASAGATDVQHVELGVPQIGVFPFVVADPGGTHSSTPPPSSPTSSGHGIEGTSAAVSSTSMSVGGTAYTGADVLEPLIVALAALGVGALLVVAGRRRGRHGQP